MGYPGTYRGSLLDFCKSVGQFSSLPVDLAKCGCGRRIGHARAVLRRRSIFGESRPGRRRSVRQNGALDTKATAICNIEAVHRSHNVDETAEDVRTIACSTQPREKRGSRALEHRANSLS
jgi:hypothetical protein